MTGFLGQTLAPGWQAALGDEFAQPYMRDLAAFLQAEIELGKQLLPPQSRWFAALNHTPLDSVRVVILGQDPYPTPGHAHGLCFSVQPDVQPLPKSLKNIYKELRDDLGIERSNGDLTAWADQGVLLLNTVLTVEAGQAGAHQRQGWERFTDRVMNVLNAHPEPKVFVLWGAHAQKKGRLLDGARHQIIESPHPSPLAAYRGFFGSRPFSQINRFLQQSGQPEIHW